MKFSNFALMLILIVFLGCSDKPEIQPDIHQFLIVNPNPAIHDSNIKVIKDQPFTLRVFDTQGNVMVEEEGNGPTDYTIQLSNQEKGRYHIILQVENKIINSQLIKI